MSRVDAAAPGGDAERSRPRYRVLPYGRRKVIGASAKNSASPRSTRQRFHPAARCDCTTERSPAPGTIRHRSIACLAGSVKVRLVTRPRTDSPRPGETVTAVLVSAVTSTLMDPRPFPRWCAGNRSR